MFERFTPLARTVVVAAAREAEAMGHSSIGAEHVLLALLTTQADTPLIAMGAASGTASKVRAEVQRLTPPPSTPFSDADADALHTIGIDLDAVTANIERAFGAGELRASAAPRRRLFRRRPPPGTRFTPPAQRALEQALRQSLRLRDRTVGPEHMLLGVLQPEDGLPARILCDAGVDATQLRQATLAALADARKSPARRP